MPDPLIDARAVRNLPGVDVGVCGYVAEIWDALERSERLSGRNLRGVAVHIAALSAGLAIAVARAQSRIYEDEQAWQDLAHEVAQEQARLRSQVPDSQSLRALRGRIEERL